MPKTLTTTLALVSLALGVLGASACAEPLEEVEERGSTESAIAAGSQIWQLFRECGTAETGACPTNRPACPEAPTNGRACGTVGDRCLTGANPAGRRKVFACNPTYAYSWSFNGTCDGAGCPGRPACPEGGPADVKGVAGGVCTKALERCAKDDRVFVCLQNGKDQYVFNGYCGKNGGPDCEKFESCPPAAEGIAGLACTPGDSCKLLQGELSGKVFSCISR